MSKVYISFMIIYSELILSRLLVADMLQ